VNSPPLLANLGVPYNYQGVSQVGNSGEAMVKSGAKTGMQIVLPKFGNTYCVGFTACGQLKAADVQGIKEQKPLVLRYRVGRHPGLVRAFFTRKPKSFHLHVDVLNGSRARPDESDDWRKPNATRKDLEQFLSHFFGMQIDVHISGHFRAPKSKLRSDGPMSLLAPTTIGDEGGTQARILGMEFTMANDPHMKLSFLDFDDAIVADFEMYCSFPITPSYLAEVMGLVDRAFNDNFIPSKEAVDNVAISER
jgi:hypothetical protein